VELLRIRDAAVVVTNGNEITDFVRRCLLSAHFRHTLGARARQIVQEHKGAADRTVDMLLSLISHQGVTSSQLPRGPDNADDNTTRNVA